MGAESGPPDQLLLDNQLCFLVYRLHRGITDLYRPLLAELDLTYPQYLVMLALWETDGLTVGQLCSRLHLDSGTVSPLLKRMEAAGMLERHRLTQDERVVRVTLTASGAQLRERAADIPAKLGRCLGLDGEDYLRYREALGSLADQVGGTQGSGAVLQAG